ncbi:MAG TPA: hypothetical protein VM120_27675 [Bryobacteraceae bacterium]|nr:hypothetical protein [Bryobacteraceae bacterium]
MAPRVLLLSVVLAAVLSAQDPIRGPMLGWVWDSKKESVRPVLGIAGSSVMGQGIDLGSAVKLGAVSGAQEFALVLLGDTRDVGIVDLKPLTPLLTRPELAAGAERFVLSPRGSAAALLYVGDTKKIVVVGGLPAAAGTLREIDLTVEGTPAAMALSDDGAVVLAAYPDTLSVLIVDADGNRWKLPKEAAVNALAFLENSHDALISTDTGVYVAREVSANAELRLLWEGANAGPVAAIDSRRVLVVDNASQSVVEVNLVSGPGRTVQCPCAPTGLSRMTGTGIFRLNEVSKGPLWLVEVQDTGLRTVFVPPDPSDPESEE